MKFAHARTMPLLLVLIVAATSECGTKTRRSEHALERTTVQPAPPTPDTTPIEALRTPAGLVLKPDSPTQTPSGPLRGPAEGGGNVSPAPSPSKP